MSQLTPEERALLNDQTMAGEGPTRDIAPGITLDALSFTRRRLLQRAASHMVRVGASDSEQLHTYILMLALPEPEARAAARSIDDLEDARKASRDIDSLETGLDTFCQSHFGMAIPASVLALARACFDHDIRSIEAAMVDTVARPGTTESQAPPNS